MIFDEEIASILIRYGADYEQVVKYYYPYLAPLLVEIIEAEKIPTKYELKSSFNSYFVVENIKNKYSKKLLELKDNYSRSYRRFDNYVIKKINENLDKNEDDEDEKASSNEKLMTTIEIEKIEELRKIELYLILEFFEIFKENMSIFTKLYLLQKNIIK
jgi:hypothetical protein